MKKITLIALMLFTALGYAQVGINTNNPDASSALEIESTTGGILIPRLTQTQRDDISAPATGLMIYQTNGTSGFYFYDGNVWTKVDGVAGPQGDAGPAGTDGTDGAPGLPGADGNDGPQGIQGATGPAGAAGSAGAQGEAGLQGIQGTQGDIGLTGATGPSGPAGANGDQGVAGSQGIQGPQGPMGTGTVPGPSGFDGNSSLWESIGVGPFPSGGFPGGGFFFLDYNVTTWGNAGQSTHQLIIHEDDGFGNNFSAWFNSVEPGDIVTIRNIPNQSETHTYEVLPMTPFSSSPPFANNGPWVGFNNFGGVPNTLHARLRLINATSLPAVNGGPFTNNTHISFVKSAHNATCSGFSGVYKGIGLLPITTPPPYGGIVVNDPDPHNVTKITFYPEDIHQQNLADYFNAMNNFGYNANKGLLTISSPVDPGQDKYSLVYLVGSTVLFPTPATATEIVVEVQFVGGVGPTVTTMPFIQNKGLCHSFCATGSAAPIMAKSVITPQPPLTTIPTVVPGIYGEVKQMFFDSARGTIVYSFPNPVFGGPDTYMEVSIMNTPSGPQFQFTVPTPSTNYPN